MNLSSAAARFYMISTNLWVRKIFHISTVSTHDCIHTGVYIIMFLVDLQQVLLYNIDNNIKLLNKNHSHIYCQCDINKCKLYIVVIIGDICTQWYLQLVIHICTQYKKFFWIIIRWQCTCNRNIKFTKPKASL